MDYQDGAYASLYLDRLALISASDDGRDDWALTSEAARYIALWMSYEDTIRVADLKVRGTRFGRVWREAGVTHHHVAGITEFMHPRYREFCDTLPAFVGRRLLHSRLATRFLSGLFSSGRLIETSSIRGFVTLSLVASLRPFRRITLRYSEEQARIDEWLDVVRSAAVSDPGVAVEIIRCQRLIKGYGDTYDRGLANFNALILAYEGMKDHPRAGDRLRALRENLLASTDDETTLPIQHAARESDGNHRRA
jgi:indolepyruvate ferredoxin oxidoreductase beta subunit